MKLLTLSVVNGTRKRMKTRNVLALGYEYFTINYFKISKLLRDSKTVWDVHNRSYKRKKALHKRNFIQIVPN